MATSIPELCLIWRSSAFDPDPNSGIPARLAFLYLLARFTLYFEPRRFLRQQRLPRLGQLAFPPKLLRRFLRGFVVATAHGLVTAPASVHVTSRKKRVLLRNRIFARVMNGFVTREERRLQAAAAARIAGRRGKYHVFDLAESGDVVEVLSFLIADADCVNERERGK